MTSSVGGGGYAPSPGGLGPVSTLTGDPAREVPGAAAAGPSPAAGPPLAPPPGMPPALPPGATLDENGQPVIDGVPARLARPPEAAPLPGIPAGASTGIPAGAFDTGMGSAAQVARGIQQNNADLAHRQTAAETADRAAVQNDAAVQGAKADAEYSAQKAAFDHNSDMQAKQAGRQEQINSANEKQRQGLESVLAQTNSTPFDPNRYVDKMNVGQRIMTAISVGLGAMSSSGHNVGLEMLNRAIEGDIAAQKSQYDRGMTAYNEKKTAYQLAREAGQDETNAARTARLDAMQTAEQGIKVVGAGFKSKEVDASRNTMLAHLQGQAVKTRSELDQSFANNSIASVNMIGQRSDQQFNRAMQLDQLSMQRDAQSGRLALAEGKLAGQGKDRGIPGWEGQGKTDGAYDKATAAVGAYESLAPIIDRMREFRKHHANGTFDRAAVGQAEAMHEAALLEVKNLGQLGVLSDSDIKLVDRMIGNSPDSIGSDDAYLGRLGEVMHYIDGKTHGSMRAWGFDPKADANPLSRSVPTREVPGGR